MMRKILTIVSVFLITLLMIPTGNVKKVSAEEGAAVVAYGAIIKKNNNNYGSLYSLRQALYLSQPSKENKVGPSKVDSAYKKDADDSLCTPSSNFDSSWTAIRDNYCTSGKLNAELASFKLHDDGEVVIDLQPDVHVERLNIYYAIAGVTENNDTPNSMVLCTAAEGFKICDHASYVTGSPALSGNWRSNDKKDGIMMYTGSTLEVAGFEVYNNPLGGKKYSAFNVIDNMSDANRKLAYKSGAYIIVTMSIRHEKDNPEHATHPDRPPTISDYYYINTPVVTTKKFTDVRSITAGNSSQIITYNNVMSDATNSSGLGDSTYEARNNKIGSHVDKYAALVAKIESGGNSFEGMESMLIEFDNYIKPVLIVALGVLLLVRGTMLIVTIIKSSDEPEVRKSSIKHLVGLFVSIFAIMMIVIFMKDIVYIMADFIAGNN